MLVVVLLQEVILWKKCMFNGRNEMLLCYGVFINAYWLGWRFLFIEEKEKGYENNRYSRLEAVLKVTKTKEMIRKTILTFP